MANIFTFLLFIAFYFQIGTALSQHMNYRQFSIFARQNGEFVPFDPNATNGQVVDPFGCPTNQRFCPNSKGCCVARETCCDFGCCPRDFECARGGDGTPLCVRTGSKGERIEDTGSYCQAGRYACSLKDAKNGGCCETNTVCTDESREEGGVCLKAKSTMRFPAGATTVTETLKSTITTSSKQSSTKNPTTTSEEEEEEETTTKKSTTRKPTATDRNEPTETTTTSSSSTSSTLPAGSAQTPPAPTGDTKVEASILEPKSEKMSVGAIVGIALGALAAIAIVILVVYLIRFFNRQTKSKHVSKSESLMKQGSPPLYGSPDPRAESRPESEQPTVLYPALAGLNGHQEATNFLPNPPHQQYTPYRQHSRLTQHAQQNSRSQYNSYYTPDSVGSAPSTRHPSMGGMSRVELPTARSSVRVEAPTGMEHVEIPTGSERTRDSALRIRGGERSYFPYEMDTTGTMPTTGKGIS